MKVFAGKRLTNMLEWKLDACGHTAHLELSKHATSDDGGPWDLRPTSTSLSFKN